MRYLFSLSLLLACCVPSADQRALAAESASGQPIAYNEQIRPILAENCFSCHGPDSASRKADLRVDRRDAAVERGAIAPGDPDASELVARLLTNDPEQQMPPPATKKKLTDQQKQLLIEWVRQGAEYQAHWALLAPERPALPAVQDTGWSDHPLDRLVLARLEQSGLSPAPAADRRTLARRLHLDLTGLPPDPQLVEEFVSDTSSDAYERLADKLLESPQWGEQRGRYWLDAARYADTHGIHFDNFREIWTYRDWVIKAFNRNLPFDQFTIEQLAGDLLPDATLDQKVASGFNRCNMTTNEGGTIPEEYLVLYTRDRTETVGQVWMGLTVGCAVCHEHKFDPLTQREFYELAAFFNNTTQAAMDGNIKDTPPVIRVPLEQERGRLEELAGEIAALQAARDQRREAARSAFEAWLASNPEAALTNTLPVDQLALHAPLSEGEGQATRVQVDGQAVDLPLEASATWQPGPAGQKALQPQGTACRLPDFGDFERDQPWTCSAWIKAPANDSFGAIAARMDNQNAFRGWDFWFQARRIGTHIVSRWPENAIKVVGRDQIAADTWTHVTVSYDGSGKATGVKVYYNGQLQPTLVESASDQITDSTRTNVAFQVGQRSDNEPLSAVALHDLRVYRRPLAPSEVASLARASHIAALLAKAADQRSDADRQALYDWWLEVLDDPYRETSAQLAQRERERDDIVARGSLAHVMNERTEPAMAYVLFRGAYDQRRDAVEAKTPAMLPPMPEHLPRNRLGFAQWLMLPEHPLTARVAVNQFWQQLFGTGIVRTTGDFGVSGEMPSDPRLLDWLAVEFRESGWDVKRLFKLIVTSATYQQSAVATPEKLEKDPDNRLFSRGPRFRMDAEMVRDYALATSGLLVRQLGGPSVKPYQPPGVWEAVAMIGSNTRDYREDEGPNVYRRSLYTMWKRSAPPASMEIFNAPAREVCTVRRERTNTPLQALVTLNDPQFVEAARALAQAALTPETFADRNALPSPDDKASPPVAIDEQRVQWLMHRVLARPASPVELPLLLESLRDLKAYYDAHENEATELARVGKLPVPAGLDVRHVAAWTMFTNQLLNLDEALNK
jgi:mono/diheme cytochrome c family protein